MVSLVHKKQPIRVNENSPILAKATKVESLCTVERDYYLLDADAATEADFNNLSLQQSDSLSTTISDESDSIHVYDLNKRETKILRHGIIKLSRNPIGEIDDTHTNSLTRRLSASTSSLLDSKIQQFNRKVFEHAKETRKPPISPTKLKSVYLNRNPRQFKMADMHLSSEEMITDGTNEGAISATVEATSSSDNNNVEIIEKTIESETLADGSVVTVTTEVIEITQNLLENEREHSAVAVVTAVERKNEQEDNSNVTLVHEEATGSEQTVHEQVLNEAEGGIEQVLVEEISHEDAPIIERQIEQNGGTRRLTDAEIIFDKQVIDHDSGEHVEIVPASTDNSAELEQPTNVNRTHSIKTVDHGNVTVEVIRQHQLEVVIVSPTQIQNSARIRKLNSDFNSLQTNGNSEKSVIEEDVISALPSVRELAKSFSATKASDPPAHSHRPKVILYILFFFFSITLI